MDLGKVNREMLLYGIALLTGACLRFYNLGAVPLSNEEAQWAMQAFLVANPGLQTSDFMVGPQPGYVFLTGMLFTLFGSSNFLSRFCPALAGSVLILLPYFLRRWMGPIAALIMTFGLALDPGLLAVSRQAGGVMMAIAFGLLAAALWVNRSVKSSGSLTGLASLSGPSVFTGAISLTITYVLSKFLWKGSQPENETTRATAEKLEPADHPGHKESGGFDGSHDAGKKWFILSSAVTILVVGTYILQYPQGLVAWFETIPAYLSGWVVPSGVPAVQLLVGLLAFELFALVFGSAGIVRWIIRLITVQDHGSQLFLPISIWAASALMLLVLYPGRQVSGLIWVCIPLWGAASFELARYIPARKVNPVSIVFAGFVFVLCALLWNALIAPSQTLVLSGNAHLEIRWALTAGVFAIAGLTLVLVGIGWSWTAASRGFVWGLSAALLVYTLSVAWGASQLRQNQAQELWYPPPGIGQAALVDSTLQDISNRFSGFPHEIQILSTVQSADMRWVLRKFKNTHYVPVLPLEDLPPVIITKVVENLPAREAAYRGQDFVWSSQTSWSGALPADFISWFAFRDSPPVNEYIILWVRGDLFPGKIENEPTEEILEEIQ